MKQLRHQETFRDVLLNCDDQVVVRDLLTSEVPQDIKERIVMLFNASIDLRNEWYRNNLPE